MKNKLLLVAFMFAFLRVSSQPCFNTDMDSIKAWWSFDDSSSTSVKDIANNHDGILNNGASYTIGKVGNAVEFDGSNDYISVPDDAKWAFGSNNFSVEFWANFSIKPLEALLQFLLIYLLEMTKVVAVPKNGFLH
nr:hypothetical protein [Bacteroidota bacterium]